jgi:hypothetical protein
MIIASGLFNATDVPQRVVSTSEDNRFSNMHVFGYSSFTASGIPVNNTQPAYFGLEESALPFKVAAGAEVLFELPGKLEQNLNNFWAAGTSGNGFYIIAH